MSERDAQTASYHWWRIAYAVFEPDMVCKVEHQIPCFEAVHRQHVANIAN